MLINRQEILELAKKFDQLCKENKIWYSLDKESLLGAIRHGGFVPWVIKFQVMVSMDSLATLQRLFPNHIVESSKDSSHKSLKITFVEDAKKWQKDQPFIEIRVVVPTTAEKYVKYASPLSKIAKVLTLKKDNLKHAINDLYVQRNEGYLLIDDKRNSDLEQSWIQVLTFKTQQASFAGFDFPVIVEYDTYLKKAFGENYITDHEVPTRTFIYPAPLKKVAE